MKTAPFLAAAALAIIALASCGGSSTSTTALNIAGTWQITVTSTVFTLSYTGTGSLQQSGNTVTGTVNFTNGACAPSATLTGTLSGTALTFDLTENGQSVGFTGTVTSDGNSATGTYSSATGGCTNGDKGNWTGTRTSSTSMSGTFTGALSESNAIPAHIVAKFTDNNGQVTGSAALMNSACFTSMNIQGTRSGDVVELEGTDSGDQQTMVLHGTFDAKQKLLALTYSVEGGHCSGESGDASLAARP